MASHGSLLQRDAMFLNTAGKNELYVLLNSGVVNIPATADQPSNPHAKNLADLERDVATLTVMRNNLELLMDPAASSQPR